MKRKILAILLAVCMVITVLPLSAGALPSTGEQEYYDENGQKITYSTFVAVTADTETLEGNKIYEVSSDITLNKMLTIADSADIGLVLRNGATLNVPKGIQTAAGKTGNLSVYTDGSDAKLIVGSEDKTESQAGSSSAGLYIKGNLTLAGGTITVRDKNQANDEEARSNGIKVENGLFTVVNCTLTATSGKINNENIFNSNAYSYGICLPDSMGVIIRNATVNASTGNIVSEGQFSGCGVSYGFYYGGMQDNDSIFKLGKNAVLNCTGGNSTVNVTGISDTVLEGLSTGLYLGRNTTIRFTDSSAKLNAKGGNVAVTGRIEYEDTASAESYGVYINGDCTLDGGVIHAECGTAELEDRTGTVSKYDIHANVLKVKNDARLDVETGYFNYLEDGNDTPKNNLCDMLKVGQAFFKPNGDLIPASGGSLIDVSIGKHDCRFAQSAPYTCNCGRNYAQEPVKYLAENGIERYCGEYTLVTRDAVKTDNSEGGLLLDGETVALTGGWYVINGTVTTQHEVMLNGSGVVNIILTDGCHFTTTNRLLGTYYMDGTAFYAQSTGSNMGKATFGSATAEDGAYFQRDVTINGGDITAIQGARTDAAGDEYSNYFAVKAKNLTVNGGKLTAKSTKTIITDAERDDTDKTYTVYSYGITVDEEFTVNGGTVTATGGDWDISGSTCDITAESMGIYMPSGSKLTVNGGSVTANGGAVTTRTTGGIACDSRSQGIVAYDENGFELNGGSVTANGGNAAANGADGDSSARSYGLYCYGAKVNGGSFTVTRGTTTSTAEDAYLPTYDVMQHGSAAPLAVSGGTVKLGTADFTKLVVKNNVKLPDLLKEGYAYCESGPETLKKLADLAELTELRDHTIVLCPHEEQTDTCAYCNKNLASPGTGSTGGGSYIPGSTATVTPAAGGTTEISNPSPAPGESVTVTPKPNNGMRVETITVTDQNGNTIAIKRSADGSFTFTQPDGDVTITVTYGEQPTFGDIPAGAWYADAVDFAVKNGLFSGTGNNKFEPNASMTRAMFSTVLWNFAGKPTGFTASYSDVKQSDWFYAAVAWASEQGVVSGTGGGKFDPLAEITREEMVTMLWNYNGKTQASGTLSAFGDHQSVSSWAQAAMQWAVSFGVISGKGNDTLDPDGTAVRAEAATVFMNYLKQ